MKIYRSRRKIINNHFEQGQENPPLYQRFAKTTTWKPYHGLQIFDTPVDFPGSVQSRGRFLIVFERLKEISFLYTNLNWINF